MSLATRCTACGTIFRVVQDQLRVSDGWVRCGRCAEVFDAREQLFDMEREAPPPWPPQPAQRVATAPAPEPEPPAQAPTTRPFDEPPPAARSAELNSASTDWAALLNANAASAADASADEELPAFAGGDVRREPFLDAPEPESEPRNELPEPRGLRAPDEPLLPSPAEPDVVLSPGLSEAASLAAEADAKPNGSKTEKSSKLSKAEKKASKKAETKPGFIKQAEGQARWQRPGVRAALIVVGLLLGATLGTQAVLHSRDALAAQFPQMRPLLASLCANAGCDIRPWRHIESISVDSSGLSQASSGNHYKLKLSLRNKSDWELALPWVELSLTDSGGKLIAKKALAPKDFQINQATIGPGAEQPLQLIFSTGEQKVAGYTIEVFHP